MASNAVDFDNASKYGKVLNFAGIDNLTDLTVECWVKNSAGSVAYSQILTIYPYDGAASSFVGLSTENGVGNTGINFGVKYDGGVNADGYTSTAYLTVGSWVHVALVHKTSTKKTHIYVNGSEISYNAQNTGTGTIRAHTTSDFYLKYNRDIGGIGGFVRVWNVVRTQTELDDNKALTMQASGETGLIINLNFTEETGTVIDNEATAGEDCNLTGTPSWIAGPTTTAKSYGGVVIKPLRTLLGIGV